MDTSLLVLVAASLRTSVRYVRPGAGALQAAITKARAGATLIVAPGTYEENIIIPRTLSALTLIGAGGRGSVAIEALTNGVALLNHADDVTLVNIGLGGNGTGAGLVNDGRRLRMAGCKLEAGADAAILAVGTVAQQEAGTYGDGSDALIEDCEFAWATNGLVLRCSDYGAVTQARLRNCVFHNLTNHVTERVGSGGSAAVGHRDLEVGHCHFLRAEDGSNPTKFFDLNDSNDNTGEVYGCTFPVAANSGLSLVSTKVLWVGNFYPAGVSAGQPS